MKKPLNKKMIIIIAIIIAVIAVIISRQIIKKNQPPQYELAKVTRSNITQEIDITGKAKPISSLDLSFEMGGKIAEVGAKVGDKVIAGQLLANIENTDLALQYEQADAGVSQAKANLLSANANLDMQNAKLDELKKGARAEEIQVAKTQLNNAKTSLTDTQASYDAAKNKADSDLSQVYDSAINSATKSITVSLHSLVVLTDIQYNYFNGNTQEGIRLSSIKAEAVKALVGADGAGSWSADSINKANGGAKATVSGALASMSQAGIDQALSQTKDALSKIKEALGAVPIYDFLLTTDKANLNLEKNNIDFEIATLSGKQEAIKNQNAIVSASLASAKASLNQAENSVKLAEDQLALKQICASPEQIRSQEALVAQADANIKGQDAAVKQAEANLKGTSNNIKKTVILSPIDGTVSQMDVKAGEVVAPDAVVAAVISENQYEVEASVPEADVIKAGVGDTARLSFDAIPDKEFTGKIGKIDPAQQLIGGVVYYTVDIYLDAQIDGLRSGMSADITAKTGSKENVLTIPKRAIIEHGLDKYVRIPVAKTYQEIRVETGLESAAGDVEVTSGLSEGQEIITFIKE